MVALIAAAFGTGVVWGESGTVRGMAPSAIVLPTPRVFSADTGLLLDYIKADQTAAYERTMRQVGESLRASRDQQRRRQADGWRVYKADEPLDGGVLLYISFLDPVVPDADYWVPQILNEAFPTEVQELYETYVGAFADGQTLLNLRRVIGP